MPDRSKKPEDLTVRLTKDGRIVIDGTGLPPRRLRELQETLREVLGPAELYDEERRESPEAPRLWGTTSEEQQEEQEDRERQAE